MVDQLTTTRRMSNASSIPDSVISIAHEEPQFKLSFLCLLIHKSFDGNRNELYEFIGNCDNAFRFSAQNQRDALLAYIISKLTGSCKAQLRDKAIRNWAELRGHLIQLYSDKKHFTTLMEELNTIKQYPNENVITLHNRIERLYTNILNSLAAESGQQTGKADLVRELAL